MGSGFFTQHIFEIHPSCSMRQCFIPFHSWVIFHCMAWPYFVYSFTHWWAFRLFLTFGCVNSAAMDICVQRFNWILFVSLGYIPRSEIAGSYSNSVFNFLVNHQTVFHTMCFNTGLLFKRCTLLLPTKERLKYIHKILAVVRSYFWISSQSWCPVKIFYY